MKKISVVVPCYNEEEALPFFYKEITQIATKMDYAEFEFLFINDGSKDKTLEILREYARMDKRVRYISFSRNFGKESAMYAGLKESTGDYVAVMDADLQDPPSLLIEMFATLEEGRYDCVATRRQTRKGESIIRSFFSRKFYKIINALSKTEIVDGARDFRLMTRQMTDSIVSLGEYNRFSKGIFGWVGFDTKWISYDNVERVAGKTSWSFWKLFIYAIDGIIAFSTTPLVVSTIIGCIFCLIALVMICVIIFKTIMYGDPVSGWPSTACIILFVGGVQLFCTGIIGQYLAKTYREVKNRPVYIVKETEEKVKTE